MRRQRQEIWHIFVHLPQQGYSLFKYLFYNLIWQFANKFCIPSAPIKTFDLIC